MDARPVSPTPEREQSIPRVFVRQVTSHPGRIAVAVGASEVTYRGLNATANSVARELLARRGARPEPIALLMEKGITLIASILGTLKAGKIYVPLDPSHPAARLSAIVQDSRSGTILTDAASRAKGQRLREGAVEVLDVDDLNRGVPAVDVEVAVLPESPAWILYTSGSTGQPKGVVQSHRNVLAFVGQYRRGLGISPEDRLTLLPSCSANLGAHNMFTALLTGASVHPFDVGREGLAGLGRWIVDRRITVYCSVPTVFRHFVDTLTEEQRFPDLRLIQLGGEPLSRRDVDLFRAHFTRGCVLFNRYGATETGSVCWYVVDHDTEVRGSTVPIGYPVEDTEVVLLDETGEVAGKGASGEIGVRSPYLTPGYWQRSDLTDSAFVTDPGRPDGRVYRTGDVGRLLPDGRLLFLGRKDRQAKVRGHRIEVEEIEMALRAHPGVKDCAVVTRDDTAGETRLVGYVVPRRPLAPRVSALRRALAERLPSHMIPSAFVVLETLPQAPNGKVDRRALPAPGSTRPELDTPFVPSRTETETVVAGIWAEVLGLDQVGVEDDFLDLGGSSLQAMQIATRVHRTLRVDVPVQALLAAPTVAGMAVAVTERQMASVGEESERILIALETLSEDEIGPSVPTDRHGECGTGA
jgi:amino acid adenylation domain-containing protein